MNSIPEEAVQQQYARLQRTQERLGYLCLFLVVLGIVLVCFYSKSLVQSLEGGVFAVLLLALLPLIVWRLVYWRCPRCHRLFEGRESKFCPQCGVRLFAPDSSH